MALLLYIVYKSEYEIKKQSWIDIDLSIIY